jgi:hypothetical protein
MEGVDSICYSIENLIQENLLLEKLLLEYIDSGISRSSYVLGLLL